MQFLSSPEWLSVIIAGLSGIVLPVVLLMVQRHNRKDKQITTEIISNTSVVYIGQEVKSKVQATFNNRSITDAHLIYLRMKNTGNDSVEITDYEVHTQIKFDFGNQAEVLEVEISDSIPSSIKSTVNITSTSGSSSISLKPFSLKGQESVTLRIIVASFEGEIRDETRLIGAKQILKARLFCVPSMRNLAITFIALMLVSPFLFIHISQYIFQTFFYVPANYPYDGSGIAIFYNSDFIGAIIVSFTIFITYSALAFLLPSYVSTTKQFIKIIKSEHQSIRNFIIIAGILLPISPLAYGAITILTARYIHSALYQYPSLTDSLLQALNICDTIGSIFTTVILVTGVYFLNKYLPIKIVETNK